MDTGFRLKESEYSHGRIFSQRKVVGHIEVAENFYISATKKPNAWHRFWLKVLLGWKWKDGDKLP